jgi:TolB-like protein
MNSLFNQLKRRNVFRVAAAYVIVGWMVLQAASLLLEIFKAPDWVSQTLAMVVALGFPIACVFAWAFEMTPEGVKRSHDVDEADSITPQTGRKLDVVIVISLVALIALTVWMRTDPPAPEIASESAALTALDEAPQSLAPTGPSIAVLPFVNMSDDPAQVYFSDGISEELLNVLVSVDGLSVASLTSSFAFKDQVLSVTEIAAKLKVGYVLEGSVRKAGDQVRITAQLIDTAQDRHLWSDTYDRSLADIFAIQTEIANEIAGALGASLGLDIGTVTVAPKTDNLSAYDYYLKGRNAWLYRKTAQDLTDSVDYLQRALELDPDFLDAKEVLAAAWLTLPFWVPQDEPVEVFEARALVLAEEVLAKDPDRVLALLAKASSLPSDTELGWVPYKELYERALELEPDNATALHWLGLMYQDLGLPEKAVPLHERCLELVPGYTNCLSQLIASLDRAGETEKARQKYEDYITFQEGPLADTDTAYALELGYPLVAAALMRQSAWFEGAPTASLIRLYENPEIDRRPILNQWEQWARENNRNLSEYVLVLALLGKYDRIDMSTWTGGIEYGRLMTGYRRSPAFKQYARETGRYATWKQLGFPRWCRPIGEDDFECE